MVWDVTDLSQPQRLSQFEGGQPTALSPDGRTVATVTFSGRTALWNVADPRHPAMIATLPGSDLRHLNPSLRGQAFSPDGQILATAYDDQVFPGDVASPARPRLLRSLDAPLRTPAGNSSEIPFSGQQLRLARMGAALTRPAGRLAPAAPDGGTRGGAGSTRSPATATRLTIEGRHITGRRNRTICMAL